MYAENSLRTSFNSVKKQKIHYALNNVGNYWPVARTKLEQENNLLYMRLKEEGIVHWQTIIIIFVSS
jgi:hypothetical protein